CPEAVRRAGGSAFPTALGGARPPAVIAAIRPPSVANDQCPDPPIPKKCTTLPRAPVLWYSQSMTGGTASISRPRPAVIPPAQPTRRARRTPRPGPPDARVAHPSRNNTSVTSAARAGTASHQVHADTDADAVLPDQLSTPCARSSQPQTWPRA